MPLLSAWNWLMVALFGLSAVLQYNDPDPLPWIAIYAAAAAACVLWGRRRATWPLAAPVAVIAAVWAALLMPEVLGHISPSDLFLRMNEKGGRVEIGREIGGLAIVLAWMVVLQVSQRHRRRG
jgi:Transmembrane family 220, helix